jgi:hypothetical protein|uniref:Uncharacterized protein n=1 Tax=viral metagenome TaxID=1070528 RepID=A0A6C0I4B0_9ZZZZ
MNANDKSTKKEEIVSRAIQILTTHLTETNEIQKIKEIVCNNSTINRAKKSNKIFHIIFSPESIDALIQNMKLTGTAKSGIGIFKASKKVSSFFSRKTTKTKTTTRRKTTTSRWRSSDPVVSQVDVYLKPESIPIIEHALEPLVKSCLSADFVNVVQSQCIEPIIKRVMTNGSDVENYFSGGGRFPKVARRRHSSSLRTRRHSQRNAK